MTDNEIRKRLDIVQARVEKLCEEMIAEGALSSQVLVVMLQMAAKKSVEYKLKLSESTSLFIEFYQDKLIDDMIQKQNSSEIVLPKTAEGKN